MQLSTTGLNLLKKYEGLRLEPYRDGGGFYTIGYGHLIKPDENYLFAGISESKAAELLKNDVREAEKAVESSLKTPVSQMQFDSLVILAYNIGGSAFKNSTLLKLINAQSPIEEIVKQWTSKYVTSNGITLPGLINRRKEEAGLFTAGYSLPDAVKNNGFLLLALLAGLLMLTKK